MLGSREVDDLSNLKQAVLGACLNECVGGDNSGVDDLLEQGHQSKPPQKCLGKRASLSTAVSPPEDDVDEIVTSLRWLFSEGLALSSWSCSASLPVSVRRSLLRLMILTFYYQCSG